MNTMRPPGVSVFFFASAIVFIFYGAFSARDNGGSQQSAVEPTSASGPDTIAEFHAVPDFSWRFNALDPGLITASAGPSLFNPADDYWGLPRADGVDLVAGYCAACHSLRIVMQQNASETRWRELMAWMIEKQGMAAPPDEDLEQIIAYLSDHFGS